MTSKDIDREINERIQAKAEKEYAQKSKEISEKIYNSKGKIIPLEIAKRITKTLKVITLNDNEQMLYYKDGIYQPNTITKIKGMSQKIASEISKHEKQEVIETIKGNSYIDRSEINKEKHLIHLQNGIYNLEKDNLQPFNSEIISTTMLPIKYNNTAECNKAIKFITEVVGADQVDLIQEMFGYCLLKEYKFNKAFMLYGTGKNGKSTLLNLLTAFLGEENISTASLQEACYNKFARIRLYGKLANIHDDLPNAKVTSTGYFKMLTGEGRVHADIKHKEGFDFKNSAKMIFSANELPKSEDTTFAFFRRWETINFNNVFDGKDCDINLLEKITTPKELSGLFNWSLNGLKRLLKNEGFSSSKTAEGIKEEWILRTDSLRAFINLCVEYAPTEYISKDEFARAVNEFCQYHNAAEITKQYIGQNLPAILPKTQAVRPLDENGKQIRAWGGIKFNEEIKNYLTDSTVIQPFTKCQKSEKKELYKSSNILGYLSIKSENTENTLQSFKNLLGNEFKRENFINLFTENPKFDENRAEKQLELWITKGIIFEYKPKLFKWVEN